MALGADSVVDIEVAGNDVPFGFVEIGSNRGLVVYEDVDDARAEARVADISGGSLSWGAAATVTPNDIVSGSHIVKLDTDKVLYVFDDSVDRDPYARILTVSGSTITPQTASAAFEAVTLSSMRVAAVSATLALAQYNTTAGRYCRLTISGNTVTPGTPVAHSDAASRPAISAVGMDDDRVLCMYRTVGGSPALRFQVVNISTGITQGTPGDPSITLSSTGADNDGPMQLARLTATKAIAVYVPSGGGVDAMIINISGNSIDSFGTPFTIPSAAASRPAIWAISSTKALSLQRGTSPNRPFAESLSISGDTISADGDGIGIPGNGAGDNFAVAVLANTLAVGVWRVAGNEATGARITGVPESPAPAAGSARFYQGAGVLTEKFTLPFSGVEPGAMTLDTALGTVVIGANTPAGQMVNYGANPYNVFTNMTDGLPTGTAITGVKWI
jgi:hypothetical protein